MLGLYTADHLTMPRLVRKVRLAAAFSVPAVLQLIVVDCVCTVFFDGRVGAAEELGLVLAVMVVALITLVRRWGEAGAVRRSRPSDRLGGVLEAEGDEPAFQVMGPSGGAALSQVNFERILSDREGALHAVEELVRSGMTPSRFMARRSTVSLARAGRSYPGGRVVAGHAR